MDIPFCMLYLDPDMNIKGYNDVFEKTMSEKSIPEITLQEIIGYPINKVISCIKQDTYRQEMFILVANKYILCLCTLINNVVFMEINSCDEWFVKYIGHQMTTPLSNSIQVLNIFEEKELKKKEYLNVVKKSNFLLLKTVNDMVEYTFVRDKYIDSNKHNFSLLELKDKVNDYVHFIDKDITLKFFYKQAEVYGEFDLLSSCIIHFITALCQSLIKQTITININVIQKTSIVIVLGLDSDQQIDIQDSEGLDKILYNFLSKILNINFDYLLFNQYRLVYPL